MSALCCPRCKSESLATVEELSASVYGTAEVDDKTGERSFDHEGWTEVHWDSSETLGYECRDCMWRGNDLSELAVAK